MLDVRKRPSFVIFDYGETLAHEDDFRPERGFQAILERATRNPRKVNADMLLHAYQECFQALRLRAIEAGAEIPNQLRLKWLFEMFDLAFSLEPDDLETLYWDATAPCVPTPGMPELLARLRALNIGTGVLSNMGFMGASLQLRLERLFPEHRFQFVISSADYVLRKPDPHLFALALKRAGCAAGEAWFVGDNLRVDIAGAAAVGMTAVHYDRDLGCAYREPANVEIMPPCLRVTDWSELYPCLEP